MENGSLEDHVPLEASGELHVHEYSQECMFWDLYNQRGGWKYDHRSHLPEYADIQIYNTFCIYEVYIVGL